MQFWFNFPCIFRIPALAEKLISMRQLLLLLCFALSIITTAVGSTPLAPAPYVFGDSLFDSGNNNFLPTICKANFRPYGVDFPQGPTGRFSNGRIFPDFIAEFLRLPYAPPYHSCRESTPLTGLNYASGSCGILPETGQYWGKCLSLDDQINLFEGTVKGKLPKHFNTTNELSDYLSNSIFIISIGNTDYLHYLRNYTQRYTPQEFAAHLLDKLSQRFERLSKLGARKIVMFDIGPLGCLPSSTRKSQHMNGKCVEESNKIVKYFNDQLAVMLRNLTATLRSSIFVNGHVNWLSYDAILNPSKYGLIDTSNPCCKAFGNGTSSCIPWTSPCSKPNEKLFFDGHHVSESFCSILASRCITNNSVCSPPLNQLVQQKPYEKFNKKNN